MPKKVDCFLFFNELDLLEIRLNALSSYMDYFVLAECPVTLSGKPKPMYFHENMARFDKFNIKYMRLNDGLSKHRMDVRYKRERYYWETLIEKTLQDMDDEDSLFQSALDEIPDMESYNGNSGVFYHKMYYYYVNVYSYHNNWRGTNVSKKKDIKNPYRWFLDRKNYKKVGNGWHFTYCGDEKSLEEKLEAYAHDEMSLPESQKQFFINRKNLQSPVYKIWGDKKDRSKKFIVQDPSGPKYLLDNRIKYRDLFYDS